MKRVIFLNKVMFICAMIFMVGCSSDSVINDTILEEITVEKRAPILEGNKTMDVLIVYVKGTSEVAKRKMRFKYIKAGLLLNWEECIIIDNDDVETWQVDPVVYYASFAGDPLVIPAREEQDNVESIMINANCNDYKSL